MCIPIAPWQTGNDTCYPMSSLCSLKTDIIFKIIIGMNMGDMFRYSGQTIYSMLGVQKNFGLIFLCCFAFASFTYQRNAVYGFVILFSMQKRNAKKAESEKKYYAAKQYVSGD
jgi:hypothetical protein